MKCSYYGTIWIPINLVAWIFGHFNFMDYHRLISWYSQVKCSSIWIPRNLVAWTRSRCSFDNIQEHAICHNVSIPGKEFVLFYSFTNSWLALNQSFMVYRLGRKPYCLSHKVYYSLLEKNILLWTTFSSTLEILDTSVNIQYLCIYFSE